MLWRAKRDPRRITRVEALWAKPKRLVDVTPRQKPDGGASLKIPLPRPRWANWLVRIPDGATKTFELDAVGLFVWNRCDGKTTVRHIIKSLAKEFDLNLRAAEVPTVQFLQTLVKRGLVGIDVHSK